MSDYNLAAHLPDLGYTNIVEVVYEVVKSNRVLQERVAELTTKLVVMSENQATRDHKLIKAIERIGSEMELKRERTAYKEELERKKRIKIDV